MYLATLVCPISTPSLSNSPWIRRRSPQRIGNAHLADKPAYLERYSWPATTAGEFLRLLEGAGLTEVKVTEHAATYFVPDTETLWRGGLGSLVLTGAVIRNRRSGD